MIKFHVLLILAVFGFQFSTAQTDTSFSKTYGTGNYEYGTDLIQTSDGSIVIAGRKDISTTRKSDGYILKIDSLGNLLWSTVIGGDELDGFNGIAELPNGNFIAVGFTTSYGSGGYDFLVASISPSGTLNWLKSFGGIDWDIARDVSISPDGGAVIVGETFSEGKGDSDGYVIKIDEQGIPEWIKTFGGIGSDGINSVQCTSTGSIYLAGYMFLNDYEKPILLELDFFGDSLKSAIPLIDSSGAWNAVQVTAQGNIIVAGQFSVLNQKQDLIKASYNSSLVQNWISSLGGPDDDLWTGITQLSNGNIAYVGYSYSSIGAGKDDVFFGIYEEDDDFVNLTTIGGSETDRGFSVEAYGKNTFIVGQTNSFGYGVDDVYLIRTNNAGLVLGIVDSVFDDLSSIQTNISNQVQNELNMKVYPNPATEVLNVLFPKSITGKITLSSTSGFIVVQDELLNEESYSIDVSNLVSGNYIVSIQGPMNFSKTYRIITINN